jgi:hypothetical protein
MSLKWRLLVDKIYLMMEDPVPRLGASRLPTYCPSHHPFCVFELHVNFWKMKYVIV